MKTQLQLVTYEQAKRLKELGFDYPTNASYSNDGCIGGHILNLSNSKLKYDCYCAPSIALALKWGRDVKGINGWVLKRAWEFFYCVEHNEQECEFSTYELAESALLDAILTILEQKI